MTHQQAVDKHAAERYLLDEMPELERFAFEAHYFECPECAESVRTGAMLQEGVKQGLLPDTGDSTARPLLVAAPAASASRATASAAGRAWLPWAVAAMLAVGLGYQTLLVTPGLRDQVVGTQALTPVALRSATRGADTTVARPGTGVLSFALDVPGIPAGTRLAYDLRTADGTSVASGTAEAPSPGTPLLLLMPGSSVRTTGGYTLSIRAADEPGSLPVDYRFTIIER